MTIDEIRRKWTEGYLGAYVQDRQDVLYLIAEVDRLRDDIVVKDEIIQKQAEMLDIASTRINKSVAEVKRLRDGIAGAHDTLVTAFIYLVTPPILCEIQDRLNKVCAILKSLLKPEGKEE